VLTADRAARRVYYLSRYLSPSSVFSGSRTIGVVEKSGKGYLQGEAQVGDAKTMICL